MGASREAKKQIISLLAALHGHDGVRWLHQFDGRWLFNHDDGAHGAELWSSDLTPMGTQLVKDICPGTADGYPHSFCEFEQRVYFAAEDGTHGVELWRTDGSAAELVADINPGAEGSHPSSLTACGGRLFFGAIDPSRGFEMHVLSGDGDAVLLQDASPGGAHSAVSQVECHTSTLGSEYLFYTVGDSEATDGGARWMSDGTPEGTRLASTPAGDRAELRRLEETSHDRPIRTGADGTSIQATPAARANGTTGPSIQWARGYTNGACESHPHAGVQLRDGGFLMIGDSVCYQQAHAALKRSIFLVRTRADGAVAWQRTLGVVGFNYGKGAIELSDGTLLLATSMSYADGDAAAMGYPFVERRVLLRLSHSGAVLHTTRFNASVPAEPGRRDGFMCVVEAEAEGGADELVVYATGYAGGDSGFDPARGGYDEAPMFFIKGGAAFVTKLVYARGEAAVPPRVAFDRPLTLALSHHLVAFQGMRLVVDAAQLVVLAASHAVGQWHVQFGLVALGRADGAVRWATLRPPPTLHPWTQSHPFAFAAAPGGGYVAVGHTIEVRPGRATTRRRVESDPGPPPFEGRGGRWRFTAGEMPTGRALKVDETGRVVWDARFLATDDSDLNTECYGAAGLADGTVVVACGTGVEPEDHPKDTPTQKTWRVFGALLSPSGQVRWAGNLTDRARLQNNAGEHVVATRDGAAAVYVDAQSWGAPSTGGNFGLMKLAPFT